MTLSKLILSTVAGRAAMVGLELQIGRHGLTSTGHLPRSQKGRWLCLCGQVLPRVPASEVGPMLEVHVALALGAEYEQNPDTPPPTDRQILSTFWEHEPTDRELLMTLMTIGMLTPTTPPEL